MEDYNGVASGRGQFRQSMIPQRKMPSPTIHIPKSSEPEEEVPWATGRESSLRRRSLAAAPLQLSDLNLRLRPVHPPPSDDPQADLLPLLSPVAASTSAAHSPDRPYFPGQPKSLAGIAVRAYCLGAAQALSIAICLLLLATTNSPLWRLFFFWASLATFHFLEFWTTAEFNTPAASVHAFLLTANWPAYAIAHAAASLECLLVSTVWPARNWSPLHSGPLILLLGLLLVVVGQVVRSAAMVQAGQSFNHTVQSRKAREHVLVTSGIYAKLRHPSYFGFFWWGLGTQLVLGNVVCFFMYAAVLWRFFSVRIRHEEEHLVRFFGDEYVDYRKKVGTKIPLIR